MSDVGAVFWKEWRELLEQFGRRRGGGLAFLMLVLMFGIIIPWQMGPLWVRSPIMLAYWAFAGGSLVVNVIVDAFAGERERHTLETLLASPLSDRAILFGKYLAAVSHGVAIVVLNLGVGLVTLNLAHREYGFLVWSPLRLAQILGFTTLWAAFIAGAGVFVSLRAATVRQAHQTFGAFFIFVILAPTIALGTLPERTQDAIATWWRMGGVDRVLWTTALVLIALDLLALALAMRRFRRGRLTLD